MVSSCNLHVKLTFTFQSDIDAVIHLSILSLSFRLLDNPSRKVQAMVKMLFLPFDFMPLLEATLTVQRRSRGEGLKRKKEARWLPLNFCY